MKPLNSLSSPCMINVSLGPFGDLPSWVPTYICSCLCSLLLLPISGEKLGVLLCERVLFLKPEFLEGLFCTPDLSLAMWSAPWMWLGVEWSTLFCLRVIHFSPAEWNIVKCLQCWHFQGKGTRESQIMAGWKSSGGWCEPQALEMNNIQKQSLFPSIVLIVSCHLPLLPSWIPFLCPFAHFSWRTMLRHYGEALRNKKGL